MSRHWTLSHSPHFGGQTKGRSRPHPPSLKILEKSATANFCFIVVATNTDLPGFLPGRSVKTAFSVLQSRVESRLKSPKRLVYAVFIDFSKALDSVPRSNLIEKLRTLHKVKGKLLRAICSVLQTNFIFVDDGLRTTDPITLSQGVLQGESLSPLLFISYLADLSWKSAAWRLSFMPMIFCSYPRTVLISIWLFEH